MSLIPGIASEAGQSTPKRGKSTTNLARQLSGHFVADGKSTNIGRKSSKSLLEFMAQDGKVDSKDAFAPPPRQPSTTSAKESSKITFTVECHGTNPGEAVFLLGSPAAMGAWQSGKAVPLKTDASS